MMTCSHTSPPCRMKAGGFFHLVPMKSVHLLTLGSSAIDLNNYICRPQK